MTVAAMATTITENIISAMAIPNEVRRLGLAATIGLIRVLVLLLGTGAIGWGLFFLPIFRQTAPPHHVALMYLQGHRFNNQTLTEQLRRLTASEKPALCNPTELHDAVALRVAVLNDTTAAPDDQSPIEAARKALHEAAQKALSCSPSDSYSWLVMFWLDAAAGRLTPEDANYLRLSYALGANEGWIGLWRIRPALATFSQLPPDLSDDAIDEFIKLLNTGMLYPEMATIFEDAAPAVQRRILDRVSTANLPARQMFARVLYDRGLDVKIPDVEVPGLRAWER
jgi:hypothetical protein